MELDRTQELQSRKKIHSMLFSTDNRKAKGTDKTIVDMSVDTRQDRTVLGRYPEDIAL